MRSLELLVHIIFEFMKRTILIFFFLSVAFLGAAQSKKAKDFYVSSFKALSMDLDARTVRPAIDQNGKKAALLKLVTTLDGFDFDVGMMGVVDVLKEVGEIWVYVPEKVQRITIRHPQFGVIRDWTFPLPIESGEVYEMILNTPEPDVAKPAQTIIVEQKFISQTPQIASGGSGLYDGEKGKTVGNREYKGLLALADFGIMDSPSYGLRVAWYRKTGVYLNFRSSFNSVSSSYSCSSDGKLQGGGTIWTTGKENVSAVNVTAGAIRRLNSWLNVYAGAGYGSKVLAWEDVNGGWAEIEDYSFKGLALDAGAVFTFGNFAFSAGINSVMFDYCQFTFGFGIRL